MFDPISLTILLVAGGTGALIASNKTLRERTGTVARANIHWLLGKATTPIAAIEVDYQRAVEGLQDMKRNTAEIVAQRKEADSQVLQTKKNIAEKKALYSFLAKEQIGLKQQLENATSDEQKVSLSKRLAESEKHINIALNKLDNAISELETYEQNATQFAASEARLREQIQFKELEIDKLQSAKKRAEGHAIRAKVHKAEAEINRIANTTTSNFNENVRKIETDANTQEALAELTAGATGEIELKKLEMSARVADLRSQLDEELGIDSSHLLPGPTSPQLLIEDKTKTN